MKMLQIQIIQGSPTRTIQAHRTVAIRKRGTLKINVCKCNRIGASGLKEMYSY